MYSNQGKWGIKKQNIIPEETSSITMRITRELGPRIFCTKVKNATNYPSQQLRHFHKHPVFCCCPKETALAVRVER